MTTVTRNQDKQRAIEAYQYVINGKNIIQLFEINGEYYQDDKYKSYVKKVPMMILNNGLGATFAFIYSKRKKENKQNRQAGVEENPKNAYDLIYSQINQWLQKSHINKPSNELMEWTIHLKSSDYRATTNEVLAFFSWLKRFADGMIEEDKDNGKKEE